MAPALSHNWETCVGSCPLVRVGRARPAHRPEPRDAFVTSHATRKIRGAHAGSSAKATFNGGAADSEKAFAAIGPGA